MIAAALPMAKRQRRTSSRRQQSSIEPTSTVKLSLVQLAGAIAIIGVAVGIYYKLNGTLDAHTEQIARETATQDRINTKVDTLTTTVNDLHEKQAVAARDAQNIADKLTDITAKIGAVQLAVSPKR